MRVWSDERRRGPCVDAHKVLEMSGGRPVSCAWLAQIIRRPTHPTYTVQLLPIRRASRSCHPAQAHTQITPRTSVQASNFTGDENLHHFVSSGRASVVLPQRLIARTCARAPTKLLCPPSLQEPSRPLSMRILFLAHIIPCLVCARQKPSSKKSAHSYFERDHKDRQ